MRVLTCLLLLVFQAAHASPPSIQVRVETAAKAVNAAPSDDAAALELQRALLAWSTAGTAWIVGSPQGDGTQEIDVVVGLMRCAPCRSNAQARTALLRIAEALRQTPVQLNLTFAYEIARRCAPAQPKDPFKASATDDVRMLKLQFAELEQVNRHTLKLLSEAKRALDEMPPAEALKRIEQIAQRPKLPVQSEQADAMQALIGYQLPTGLAKLREARRAYLEGPLTPPSPSAPAPPR